METDHPADFSTAPRQFENRRAAETISATQYAAAS
jgi:hypothetical protein